MSAAHASTSLVLAAVTILMAPQTSYGSRSSIWLAAQQDQPAQQADPQPPDTTVKPSGDTSAPNKKKEEPACVTVPQPDPGCAGSHKRFVRTCKPNDVKTFLQCL